MGDDVTEEACSLCSSLPANERVAFRSMLDAVPLQQDVCDRCLVAFFRNIGFPVDSDDPDDH